MMGQPPVWLAAAAGLGAGIVGMLVLRLRKKDAALIRPQIVLFGDSITQQSFNPRTAGFGAALADWYARQADVLNRGFSGYNTKQALPLLKRLLPLGCAQPPALLTIFFGANDAADAALNPQQHVPLAAYRANLEAMVAHVKAACPGTRIVLVTPPPVAGERWAEACKAFGRAGPPDRVREVVAKYAAEVLAVGAAEAVAVLDLWKAGIGPDDLSDGLHFGSGGNQKTFSALQACIRDRFGEELNADDGPDGMPLMPMQFPYWMQATAENIPQWRWPRSGVSAAAAHPNEVARAKAERG